MLFRSRHHADHIDLLRGPVPGAVHRDNGDGIDTHLQRDRAGEIAGGRGLHAYGAAFSHAAVETGSEVRVNTSREFQTFSNPRIKIVYEDDDIIVVNKGYGLLSVGPDSKRDGTAYSILRDYVKRVDPRQKLFIVHRLDQHTSGLMMFAKTAEAKETMQHNWNNMVLERRYVAVVEGGAPDPSEGIVRSRLAENAEHVVYVTADAEAGREAVTEYRTLAARGNYALVELQLATGRKNQIRVHMQQIGHPIAGDRKYGAATAPIRRLALHARTLRFVHPRTRRDMNFSTPVPASFKSLV